MEWTVTDGEEKEDRRNKDCTAKMDTQKLYNDIHVVCTFIKENTCCVHRHTSEKYSQNTLHDHSKFETDILSVPDSDWLCLNRSVRISEH